MSITRTPRRRRLGATSIIIGAALMAVGFLASPAQAALGDPVFGAGYDSYLNEQQRGISSDTFSDSTNCPTDEAVAGLTAWHFVLSANTHDFASLDVAFTVEGTDFTMSGLTPKTTADWATFDPDLNFIADPDGKHAYVYTEGTGGTVRDAAAQDSPDSTGPKFQLSHVCKADSTTDTGTTDTGTTDTGGVLGTTGSQDTGGTDAQVKGEVVLPQQLPATGAHDRSLFIIGMGFLAIGAIALMAKRELYNRS